jgi:DNA-binding XRE family transcriptional regulator
VAIREKRSTRRSRDNGHQAIELALAILVERIQSLPPADKADLYELLKELPKAENCEELDSIVVTMEEILDQSPVRLKKMDQEAELQPGPGLQKWIDYVSGKIRTLREQANLTQVELAEKSGLPQSHISRLEGGKHSPSRVTLEKIAAALGVPVSELDPSA